jgi:prevent-host-death family protein
MARLISDTFPALFHTFLPSLSQPRTSHDTIDKMHIMSILYIMPNISVADARMHLSEVLGKVAYGGQTFLITKKGRPMAQLVPLPAPKPYRKKIKRTITVKGWLEDDDPFFKHIESIREAQRAEKPRNPFPWIRKKK